MPPPGSPTVVRVPVLPNVTWAPGTPIEVGTPRLPKFTRRPGRRLIERRRRKLIESLSAHGCGNDVVTARKDSVVLDSGFAWFVAILDAGHEHDGDSGLRAGSGFAIGAASGESIEVGMRKGTTGVGPAKVKAARDISGLTQADAAALVHTSISNWRNWEQGRYLMILAHYELFLLKTGQLTLGETVCGEAPVLDTTDSMGARIRALREAKNLTQADLAMAAGVTKAAISAWETGYSANIKLATLLRVLDVLGASKVEDLIYGEHGLKR
jgi:transcriptional regulator with XRE-family HTH domain